MKTLTRRLDFEHARRYRCGRCACGAPLESETALACRTCDRHVARTPLNPRSVWALAALLKESAP